MSTTTTETTPGQPDIQYTPDYDKYEARGKLRLQSEDLPKTLPQGFPEKLTGDLVWEGEGLKDKYNWTYELKREELEEIEAGLAHFKSLNIPLGEVNQETFPLPNLHPTLRSLSKELHSGHGFFVLRGLPVSTHSRPDIIAIYAGVSSHIAPVRGRQDKQYQGTPADVVLNHIKDLSATHSSSIGAPAYTADKQVFHTDAGDIVSLFCLSEAAQGGTSRLASTWRVYNELAATRPDLIHTLAGDWPFENFGNVEQPYSARPLLHHLPATADAGARVALQYARRSFTGFGALPRSKEIPPITEAQAEALDALHYLGERFNVGLDFRQGDVQYVNNLAVFHARDGFTDEGEQRRHLVRLWLRDPEFAWETPALLKEKWEGLYEGVNAERQVFPLEPSVRSESKGFGKGVVGGKSY